MFDVFFDKIKKSFQNLMKNKFNNNIEEQKDSQNSYLYSYSAIRKYAHENRTWISAVVAGSVLFGLLKTTIDKTAKEVCLRILDEDTSGLRDDRKFEVEARPVTIGIMTKRITAIGRTRASESVTIKAETNARIKEILFNEGGTVDKDQIILLFENEDLKARLKQAEVALNTARLQFNRTAKLHEQKFGSPKEYEKDKGALEEAEARVAQLKADLEKTIIKAPFSGQIGIMDFNVGSYISSNTDLVSLVQSNPMKIDFKIPGKFAKDVGPGQTVEITVDAFKDRVFTAYVDAIDSKIDEESNSISVRASTQNEVGDLVPGWFANVSLIIGERVDTQMVEQSAVSREGDINYVWVVEKGKAYRRPVKTGVYEKGMVEIISGLKKEDVVVTAGNHKLPADGVKVIVLGNENSDAEKQKKSDETKPSTTPLASQKNDPSIKQTPQK